MSKVKQNVVMYQRMFIVLLFDILFTLLASFLAIYTRLEFHMDWLMWENYLSIAIYDALITIIVCAVLNLYRSLWRFASMTEMRRIVYAITVMAFVKVLLFELVMNVGIPRSWYVFDPLLLAVFLTSTRFSYRNLRSIRNNLNYVWNNDLPCDNVMIIGAGEAGNVLLREIILSNKMTKKVVCIIDDDALKVGSYMNGVKIIGGRDKIIDAARDYHVDEIYLALPSASKTEKREIIEIAKETGCVLKTLPGVYQMVNGEISVKGLKDVEIEDLLGRDPIQVNMEQIASYVKDKVIMITGGGGSIGSELCRQVARNNPKMLVIVDIYENNAYDIQMELKEKYPHLNLEVRIASIRDAKKMDLLFDEFRPDVLYHAAAHKHVPLMEDSPNEAIKNNVFGTLNIVRCADKYKVKRFVQISTDKAVNPTNIMGATKRMCEMIIQGYNRKSETEYTAVRFGNVLGSNGSVIPLFKKQIAHGGPVTVTHKDIIRYFMTIPEAVSLVMQAGIYAKGGEIFVLDMGEPVKIDDLARNLIKLSGYIPDVEIPVVYTGLRPGEKLYEELLMYEEGLQKTENKSVFIGQPIDFDEDDYFRQLEELREVVESEDPNIKQYIQKIVTTYTIKEGN